MKYGFVMPPEDPLTLVDFAVEAEAAGWDGFFVSESWWSVDAWICLTAAAMRTERIRLGTLLSPLSTMRPWKIASEAATLDQLSNGRVILTTGLGAPDIGFAEFGEETDRRTRAALVDEGLDIIIKLWARQPFQYEGEHYTVDLRKMRASVPSPRQQPRLPIWVVAAWPRPKSMQRALRCDGLIPIIMPKGQKGRSATPDDIRSIRTWIAARRGANTPFNIVMEGQTPGDDPEAARSMMDAWEAAGVTWWIESWWGAPQKREQRLRQGPVSVL